MPKDQTAAWVQSVADAGIGNLWIHQQTDTPEALRLAKERGLRTEHGTCAVMYVRNGLQRTLPPSRDHEAHQTVLAAVEETQTASWQDDGGGTATATAATARILVAYATRHGSTAEVAEAVGAELRDADVDVTVAQIGGGLRAEGYDAVVVGGPMIMGWHRDAARFLTKNAAALADRPTACFATAASLTQTPGEPGAACRCSATPGWSRRRDGPTTSPSRSVHQPAALP